MNETYKRTNNKAVEKGGISMGKQKFVRKEGSSFGFTIIEVVLVLAIAGLIFLMVFIALPALQRGQHDTQRKSDLAKVATQLTSYQSSSRGAIPSSDSELVSFIHNFLTGNGHKAGTEYTDPSGDQYTFHFKSNPTDVANISYWPKATCDINGTLGSGVASSTVTRDYALTISLEGQSIPYCLDNKG